VLAFIPHANLPATGATSISFRRPAARPTFSLALHHSFGNDQSGPMGLFGGGQRQQQRQQRRQQSGSDKDKDKQAAHWSQSINGGFNFNSLRSDALNPFPDLGGKIRVHNLNGNFGHNLSRGVFLNSLRFNTTAATTKPATGSPCG